MGDYDTSLGNAKDSELQDFLMMEKQKAQVNAQVRMTEISKLWWKHKTHFFLDSRVQWNLLGKMHGQAF